MWTHAWVMLIPSFCDAMDKIAGLDASFNANFDAKFQEVLARLPP
jgi:hypothetical protein